MVSEIYRLHPDVQAQHKGVLPEKWVQNLKKGDFVFVVGKESDKFHFIVDMNTGEETKTILEKGREFKTVGRVKVIMENYELLCVRWLDIRETKLATEGCFLLNGKPAHHTKQNYRDIKIIPYE